MKIYKRFINWNVNLCVGMTPISPTFAVFQITQPSILEISGHIGLKHRGNYPVGVGYGLRVGLRSGATEQAVTTSVALNSGMPPWMHGLKCAGNILYDQNQPNIFQHYAQGVLIGCTDPAQPLQPGWYRAEVWGNCHGASNGPALSTSSSVVEVEGGGGATDPNNTMIYKIIPV